MCRRCRRRVRNFLSHYQNQHVEFVPVAIGGSVRAVVRGYRRLFGCPSCGARFRHAGRFGVS